MRAVSLFILAPGCLWIGAAEHEERKVLLAVEFELADINPDAWSLCEGPVPSFAVAGSVAGRHQGETFDAWIEIEGDVRRQVGQVQADPASSQDRSTVTFQVELEDLPAATECGGACDLSFVVGLSRLGFEDQADGAITIVAGTDPTLVSPRFTGAQGSVPVPGIALQVDPPDSVDVEVWTDVVFEVQDAHQPLGIGGDASLVACPVGLDPLVDAQACVEIPAASTPGAQGDAAFRAPLASLGQAGCQPGADPTARWALFGKLQSHPCGGPFVFDLGAPPLRFVRPDCDDDGYTSADGDCADEDPARHPAIDEVWYDGVDGDCSGGSDYDQDGDGVDANDHGGTDCDDLDSSRFPGADELCDGRDNDCDGSEVEDQATLITTSGALNHATVQAAIQAASDGDTVAVCPGVYREALVVDASITLRGASPATTHLEPDTPDVPAIRIDGSGLDVVIEGLRISGASGTDGGAIDARGADLLEITDCEIQGNTATRGGGLLVNGAVVLTDTLVAGNVADDGGGIATEPGTTLELRGATFVRANQALFAGGGVHAPESTLLLDDTATLDQNAAPLGGGIALVGTGVLDGGTLDGNTATEGAGVALIEDAVPPVFDVTNTTVQNHDDPINARGAGIWVRGDGIELNLDGVTLSQGLVFDSGGGLYVEGTGAPAAVSLKDTTITGNEANNDGGGVFALNTELGLDGDIVSSNTANNGGGLFVDTVTLDADGTEMNLNAAFNEGGALMGLDLTLTARGANFDQNSANRGGVGLFDGGSATFTNGDWTANEALQRGGAILLRGGVEITWTGTLTANGNHVGGASHAAWVEGGILYGCDSVDVSDALFPAGASGTSFNPSSNGCFEIDADSFSFGDCTTLPPC